MDGLVIAPFPLLNSNYSLRGPLSVKDLKEYRGIQSPSKISEIRGRYEGNQEDRNYNMRGRLRRA